METFAKHSQISFLFLLTPLLSKLAAEKTPFLSSWELVCVNTIVRGARAPGRKDIHRAAHPKRQLTIGPPGEEITTHQLGTTGRQLCVLGSFPIYWAFNSLLKYFSAKTVISLVVGACLCCLLFKRGAKFYPLHQLYVRIVLYCPHQQRSKPILAWLKEIQKSESFQELLGSQAWQVEALFN